MSFAKRRLYLKKSSAPRVFLLIQALQYLKKYATLMKANKNTFKITSRAASGHDGRLRSGKKPDDRVDLTGTD